MRRRTLVTATLLTILIPGVALGWWWLNGHRLEVDWDPEWPEALRATGESVETIVPGPGGTVSEGDRARAAERALWKAYYYAQLRAAERLGELNISQDTTIDDFELVDQEVRSSFSGTVRAAVEIESERSVEELGDAVRARVVVEIPPARLVSFKTLLFEALRSGRISLEKVEPVADSEAEDEAPATAAPGAPPPAAPEPATTQEPAVPAAPSSGGPGPGPIVRPPEATGVVLRQLTKGSHAPVATIFDAAGSELGTTLDLPADRRAAGLPLVEDAASVRVWAGDSPRRYDVTVSRGDLFLTQRLSGEEALDFREWLWSGKIAVVVTPEGD